MFFYQYLDTNYVKAESQTSLAGISIIEKQENLKLDLSSSYFELFIFWAIPPLKSQ